VGGGKVEIQNQDSHFSTAQNRLRRKENNCRLHKTLDAPRYTGFQEYPIARICHAAQTAVIYMACHATQKASAEEKVC
jgi:hypothetical protein